MALLIKKREFLAGVLSLAAAGAARAQDEAAGASKVPTRAVTTTVLFKTPGYPNAMAAAPDGLWIGEQRPENMQKVVPTHVPEKCWRLDWTGAIQKTISNDDTYNTSGLAFGDGRLWIASNAVSHYNILEIDPGSGKTIKTTPVPLGGGTLNELFYVKGKLWVTSSRLRGVLRVDATTYEPEYLIPVAIGRMHGLTWDNGMIWLVTGTTADTGYVMRDGKMQRKVNKVALHRYDASNGQLMEILTFADDISDPHALAMHNGKIVAVDAGLAGSSPSGSPTASTVFQVDPV